MTSAPITIEPVVSYPRTARPGERHCLTIDVRHHHPPEQWPYPGEELALTCFLETALFSHEPLGDQKVVLHRFGGSYGPAIFLLTAREKPQKGGITLSLVNRYGIPVHTMVLRDIEITETPSPIEAPRTPVRIPSEVRPSDSVRPPEQGWLSFSGPIQPQRVQSIRAVLTDFREFLQTNRTVVETIPPVHVMIDTGSTVSASYDPRMRRISLHTLLTNSVDAILLEYAHHVLMMEESDSLSGQAAGIQSGLADYLVCSFRGNPHFGLDLADILHANRPFLRNLDNAFHAPIPDSPPHVQGEFWGGVFWELGERLNHRLVNPILAQAWRERRMGFVNRLMDLLDEQPPDEAVTAREILKSRGLLGKEVGKALGNLGTSEAHPTFERPEVEQLLSLLKGRERPRLICLEGYFGQGVTTVLKRVEEHLKVQELPMRILWIDAARTLPNSHMEFGTPEALVAFIERQMQPTNSRPSLPRQLRPVVAIDNFHDFIHPPKARRGASFSTEYDTKSLLHKLTKLDGQVILATRPDTLEVPIGTRLKLRDLDARHIQHLARMHRVSLSEEGAQEFVQWTGGSVRLARIALDKAHVHKWSFEDLMRFESEEWLSIFDPEIERVRSLLKNQPKPLSLLRDLASSPTPVIVLGREEVRLLEGEGLIQKNQDGRWSLRTPLYKRVFDPNASVQLPSEFRLQFAPRSWMLVSAAGLRGNYCVVELSLFSADARNEPLHGPIRFRLTPDIEQTALVQQGIARARFQVPAPFGPMTAYAETLDKRYRLAIPIERKEAASSQPGSSHVMSTGPLRLGTQEGPTPQSFTLEMGELTTHSAFLGGSGSGKTTVALNMVEQLLLRGIPAILVDHKGDMAAYARQEAWQEKLEDSILAERRHLLREHVDVALYTPGLSDGRPLTIPFVPHGLETYLPFERNQGIQQAAGAIAGMLQYKNSRRDKAARELLGKALQLLMQRAMGREVTLEALQQFLQTEDPELIRETRGLAPSSFPKLALDLAMLRLNTRTLLSTSGERLDIEELLGWGPTGVSGQTRLSIISTKFLGGMPIVQFWVSQFLLEMNRWVSQNPSSGLQAVLLFNEADLYLPAQSQPITKQPMENLLKRARSSGIGMMLVTQNPADLDYKCRENVRTWFVGRVKEEIALKKLKPMIGGDATARLPVQKPGQLLVQRDGKVQHLNADRNVILTEQLSEDELLRLAHHTLERSTATRTPRR
jgi:hypothetical protein